MTPQQITDALEEIISNIQDVRMLIYQLKENLEAAGKANQAIDVVYADIWMDAQLGSMRNSLRLMESDLSNALEITRLRKGEP